MLERFDKFRERRKFPSTPYELSLVDRLDQVLAPNQGEDPLFLLEPFECVSARGKAVGWWSLVSK